jgi:Cupin superfamily (DUF985)
MILKLYAQTLLIARSFCLYICLLLALSQVVLTDAPMLIAPLFCAHVAVQDGKYTAMKLGLNFAAGERPHFTVKGGSWFGSCLEKLDAPATATSDSDASASTSSDTPFVLAGCTVAPGFDFADFELPTRCVSFCALKLYALQQPCSAAAVMQRAVLLMTARLAHHFA